MLAASRHRTWPRTDSHLTPTAKTNWGRLGWPLAVVAFLLAAWIVSSRLNLYKDYLFPYPGSVVESFREEWSTGRLMRDIVASLFRVTIGWTLGAVLGIVLGLWLGLRATPRAALLPLVNFGRGLSPIAWLPFAILWFQIGDKAAIFVIFLCVFSPMALATLAAVASIPSVYFRVARDYEIRGLALLTQVTLPAVLPQLITSLRVMVGLAWVVLVAAEMVGCTDGLGYAIYDARNGQRTDTVVCLMIVIGLLGVGLDRLLAQLTKLPNVRWGYDR